jgi:hypothetical protein
VESEPAGRSGEPTLELPILFVSDASAETERLTSALRARRYVTIDVPTALLAGRVAVQRPDLILCDADEDGAIEALDKVRKLSADRPIPVILIGEGDRALATMNLDVAHAVFTRPLDAAALLATVARLVGMPRDPLMSFPPQARGAKPLNSSRPPLGRNPSTGPSSPGENPKPRSDRDGGSVMPGLSGDSSGDAPVPRVGETPTVELAEEIRRLLADAEDRLGERRPDLGIDAPGPEEDVDGTLPPEVLAALDEPLDDEDGSDEGGTGESAAENTGALAAARGGKRGITQMGGTGTGLGTDAAVSSIGRDEAGTGSDVGSPNTALLTRPGDQRPTEPPPGTDDARRARQQASTPKPPKPDPDDDAMASSRAPSARNSAAPETSAEPYVADDLQRRGPPQARDSQGPQGTTGLTGLDEAQAAEIREGPNASTAPPLRRRSDRALDEEVVERIPDARVPRTAQKQMRGMERFEVPAVLRAGDAVLLLAKVIRTRFTGALAFEVDEGIRRVVFREGDFVTAASGVHAESLVAFLAGRGDLPAEVARQAHKLPPHGRRAGAALIAHGHLAQDQLWSVLRAHAEWLIGRVVRIERGNASVEDEALGRLQDEPAVFGGATGAEVLVEVVRRAVPPNEATARIGGPESTLVLGPAKSLLGECALTTTETERVQHVGGGSIHEIVDGVDDPSFASVLYALVALDILVTEAARARPKAEPDSRAFRDELDDDALRLRILARKALVDDGDYFSVLGVPRDATGYDIRRAYTTLRREFEPSRALTGTTADLGDVLDEIVDVLEEAYEILSDQRRRDRYRRAIEATP